MQEVAAAPAGAGGAPLAPVGTGPEPTTVVSERRPRRGLWGRVLRRPTAVLSISVFAAIVLACLAAPLYATHIAHSGPNTNHVTEQITVGGHQVDVVSKGSTSMVGGQLKFVPGGVPIGPQLWHAQGRFVLGADDNGRDVAVRILYGGRNSLAVGIGSALLATGLAVLLALAAVQFGGAVDFVVARLFDLIWSFPVILLAIGLGTALAISGFHHFGINVDSGSLWIPTCVIAFAIVPYLGRPLRAALRSVKQREFVLAARAIGTRPLRMMTRELLPNVLPIVVVFMPLLVALNIEFEAGLSFIGAGVQPPNPSWGTLVADGAERIVTAPWMAIFPGIAIVAAALALNVFGDVLRDELDPHGQAVI